MTGRRARRIAAAALACLVLAACGADEAPAPALHTPGVVVLGIDGLDYRMLGPAIARGELPNFARLVREGAAGPLWTANVALPPISPRIWTSIATGVGPSAHGIPWFVYEDPKSGETRLYDARHRRAPAAWEIASQAGVRTGVVNWWFSYPVEAIDGFMIAPRFISSADQRIAEHVGAVVDADVGAALHPPGLADALSGVALDQPEQTLSAEQAERQDRVVFDLTAAAREQHAVDLLMVYTRGLDELSHVTWAGHAASPDIDATHNEPLRYLRRLDTMLGAFVATLPGEHHLVVLSDHGFERAGADALLPGKHDSMASANAATLILHGPRVRPGAEIAGATVLDVLPTILELLGVAADAALPGGVIDAAFIDEERVARRDAPYARLAAREADAPRTLPADRATIERLEALGYLEAGGETPPAAQPAR